MWGTSRKPPISIRVLSAILCITVSWTPFAITWADSITEAKGTAQAFSATFQMPSVNNGAIVFPAGNAPLDIVDIYPDADTGTASYESLFGNDAAALAAGLTTQTQLTTENSPEGEAYRTAARLFNAPRPDMTNDPIFQGIDNVYANIDVFQQNFQDCTMETVFTEGTRNGHIPDYYTCERVANLPNGHCNIAHNYTADPGTHTLVDAPWVTDSCVNGAKAIDSGFCTGTYQCDDEPVPGSMTLDTVTVSVGALMVEETNISIDLTTGAWSVTGTSDARDTVAQVDHLLDYDKICTGSEINVVMQPIQDWPDVPFGRRGQGYDTTHCAQVVTPPSCANRLVTTIRLLDNCRVGSGNSVARFGKKVPIELEGANCIDLNGTIVCDPQLPQAPLANVSPLCRIVGVDANCNLNVGQMDCYTDTQGVEHCPFNDGSAPDNCLAYQNDPQCAFVSSDCVTGATDNTGTCYVTEETWDCGETVGIPMLQRAEQVNCSGPVQCMGGQCVSQPPVSAESDLYAAAALLQAAQAVAMDTDCPDPVNGDCKIFNGEAFQCKKAVGGVVDCCTKPDNVSLGDYITLMSAMMKADNLVMDLSPTSRVRGAWELVRNPVVGAWDSAKGWMTSSVNSITGRTVPAATEASAKATATTFAETMTQKTAEWVFNTFGEQATNTLFVSAAGGTGSGGAAVQGGALSSAVNLAPWITTAFTAIMWAYMIYSVAMLLIQIIWECEEEEFNLGAKRKLKSCHKVGSYCKSHVASVCVEKRESYCCYNSPLARIVQEQAHIQLGLGWGSDDNPSCAGIDIATLGRLDWSAMDLSEWVAILQSTGHLNTLGSLNIDAITGAGSEYNINGNRLDTAERTRVRLHGLDANQIRSDAGNDLRSSINIP